ncbi:MAG: hypothetical protein ACF8PN_00060 [Phycisphaerales bacterium]
MKKVLVSALAAVALMVITAVSTNAQVTIINIGTLGTGDSVSGPTNFTGGGEVYVGLANLRSNGGLAFSTEGHGADTEIAIYGGNALGLQACNDDGGSGAAGSFALASYIWNGSAPSVDPGTAYYGPTCPGPWDDSRQAANISGAATFVVATFATSWDEFDLRDTPNCAGPGAGSGSGNAMIDVY